MKRIHLWRRVSILAVVSLFSLATVVYALHSQSYEIYNDLHRTLKVTVHCSDESSCVVNAKGEESTLFSVAGNVIALEVNGEVVSAGEAKSVFLNKEKHVIVDFTKPGYATIFEDDCGRL